MLKSTFEALFKLKRDETTPCWILVMFALSQIRIAKSRIRARFALDTLCDADHGPSRRVCRDR